MALSSLPRPAHVWLARAAPVIVAVSAALAGCGTDSPSAAAPDPGGSSTAIDNCGFDVTVDEPPERVVTIKSTSTEMMLALGLADRLIGTAFADGPVPDQYADELTEVPILSDKVPGQEALLEVEPDFVFGGWESNFGVDGAGERDTLAGFDVTTYVAPSACQDPAYQPDPMTFDKLFDHIRELAGIFDVSNRAEELIDEHQALLDSVDAPGDGLTALWYSSGEDAPFVGGNIGAPAMMMRELGVENVFADIDDTWANVGWEDVIERDPDVIILVDATWNTVENKIDLLGSNPATAVLPAVEEERFLTLPFPAAEASVRNAQAVVDLAAQLDRLNLPDGSTSRG